MTDDIAAAIRDICHALHRDRRTVRVGSWHYDIMRRYWSGPGGVYITDNAIEASMPTFTPQADPRTMGERVLGFAYGSPEAIRQRLTGALYYEAVDAVLRAERDR